MATKTFTVGQYCLFQKLGKGSFANVYKAYHVVNKKEFAIKVISLDKLGNDERLHQNLLSEIGIMRDYHHESIVLLVEHFTSANRIYLVLEFCAGGDLQKFIRKHTRLDEIKCVRRFIFQLASGLDFLHKKNIIHRDIKSQVI